MRNKYIKRNGELKDKEIIKALKQCADDYENGEIVEVFDELHYIMYALQEFVNNN